MIILHENVLTDDYVENGTLHYFTYATEWSDREHIKKFGTTAQALEWYENNFRDRVIDQGRYWYWEGRDSDKDYSPSDVTEDDAINEWENLTYGCIED